jgi:hypothetical protein
MKRDDLGVNEFLSMKIIYPRSYLPLTLPKMIDVSLEIISISG